MQVLPAYSMQDYAQEMSGILQKMATLPGQDVGVRIDCASQFFMDKPYIAGALGEGVNGRFDQSPLYRTDVFDCVTFVNTVLALAISLMLPEFEENMLKINYRHAKLEYAHRYHFTSVDWNAENAIAGLLEDITHSLKGFDGKKMAQTAEAIIDRPNWFAKRMPSDLKLLHPLTLEAEEELLNEMRALSKLVKSEKSKISYLPLDKLFNEKGSADHTLFASIPHGSIIEIVRPNWDLREKIGTCLNVSHIGFALWRGKQLMFRNASMLQDKVSDVPLKRYLYRECVLKSQTVKGINVQKVHWVF